MIADLRNKRGFLWNNRWFCNEGVDHDHNAIKILAKYRNLYPEENWDWWVKSPSAKDFLVFKKKALQIGSAGKPECIIASAHFYASREHYIEKIKEDYNLSGYEVILIWDKNQEEKEEE